MAYKRFKMTKRNSNRRFRKGQRTNKMNTRPRPTRGGTRL